ncbi:hypothetical protein GMD78_07305 [Ornithinibacillus sp. L9]|uniref:Uncharacterized protein n=1 Tax=Ornithinibacillus caprae TaxID=2678566 RepID=A0A6N8FK93_9BACI|nr:hypothetical protein [Ornithinibacillus caprae]MUK88199.1 hypothetical protein [Ornithinibacillus caprae]
MDRTITERSRKTTNNQRMFQRDLFLRDQKKNLEYLSEVFEEIGFITETIEIDSRSIFSPIVKFVNHEKKAVKFNTLLTVMGLSNFRITPRGKLVKFEAVLKKHVNREGSRRKQHISRIAKVTTSDVKLLADLLSSKRSQITTYLNVTRELEI